MIKTSIRLIDFLVHEYYERGVKIEITRYPGDEFTLKWGDVEFLDICEEKDEYSEYLKVVSFKFEGREYHDYPVKDLVKLATKDDWINYETLTKNLSKLSKLAKKYEEPMLPDPFQILCEK